MSEIITVGLDLAKNVFQAHGADAAGRAVLRKKLRRDQELAFFSQLEPCIVAMEACGGAHFWGREIGKLGHEVRLIPPAYVKPFVKRQKNDAADAEAIRRAALRPTMRFVPVKSEGTQGAAMGIGLPRARVADPAEDAGDQRPARPSDRVWSGGSQGRRQCHPSRGPDRRSGKRPTGTGRDDLAGAGRRHRELRYGNCETRCRDPQSGQGELVLSRIRAAPSAHLGHFAFESQGAFPAQC